MRLLDKMLFLLFCSFVIATTASAVEINYLRKDSKAHEYGIHVWGESIKKSQRTVWPEVHSLSTVVNLDTQNESPFYVIVHKNGQSDLGPVEVDPTKGDKVFFIQGAGKAFYSEQEAKEALEKVYDLKGRWIEQKTVAWPSQLSENHQIELYHNDKGAIRVKGNQVLVEGKEITPIKGILKGNFHNEESSFYKRWAFLRDHQFSKIEFDLNESQARNLVKEHMVVVVRDEQGNIIDNSGLQKAGVLDQLFSNKEVDLGAVVSKNKVNINLWSPTARKIRLRIYDNATTKNYRTMEMIEKNGLWTSELPLSDEDKYYVYEIEQFQREAGEIETHLVTDPYSLSLSENSKRSQIVNLDKSFAPKGWDKHKTTEYYPLESPTDMTIYELHTRDFSIFDPKVPANEKGTFKAFTRRESHGMKHLSELAKSGLTHIHLLPINDMASINENREERIELTDKMEKLDPNHEFKDKTILEVLEGLPIDSDQQQEIMTKIKDLDGFNWGYDPHHYMAPEGAYASDTNGGARVKELREAVQSLHESGLRVIVDVVFNHTYDNSVFNKIVPDYYYRLDHFGVATKDSCCFDTASENTMVQKLIKDATVNWVRHYKLDGIRFDLMNFLTKETLIDIRESINSLTLEKDGVNGKGVYLYGEGWDFGSLKWLLPEESLHQWGAASLKMGLGSFNHIFRDSIKGKGQNERELFVDDSFLTDKTENRDQVKLALRATMNDWHDGIYNGPDETINYLTAHDKATLFDHLLAKVGLWAPMEKVVKMQQMGIGFISLAQGIPFFHAGVEILRSKSGDENSYNSGDWFNRLDYTYTTNNWRKGLPPAWQEENLHAWPNWKERLLKIPTPSSDQIKNNLEWFKTMLQTRKSSPLFRLRTREQVQQKVSFPENITDKNGNHDPRLLVMKIDDRNGEKIDSENKAAYVLFNTSWNEWLHFQDEDIKNNNLVLAKDLSESNEKVLKELLDNSGTESREEAFIDKKNGKISVPCMSLMVYFLK